MKTFRYIDNTATLRLDEEQCIGCGNCVTVCPHRIYRIVGKKAVIEDFNACMECGACVTNCPTRALSVKPGVGCAEAFINQWIGRITGREGGGSCC